MNADIFPHGITPALGEQAAQPVLLRAGRLWVVALLWGVAVMGCASSPPAHSPTSVADKPSLEAVQQADALYGQQQFAQAQVAFKRLVEHNPRNAYFWFRLGNCEAQLRRYPLAIEAFNKALALDPSDGRFAYNLAFAHSAIARDAFALARNLLPQSAALRQEAEQNGRLMEAAVGAAVVP